MIIDERRVYRDNSVTNEGKVKIIDYSEGIAGNPKYQKDPEK